MSSSKCFLSARASKKFFMFSLAKRETTSGTRNEKRRTLRMSIMLILALDVDDLGDLALFVKYNKMNSCVHISFSLLTSL